MSDDTPPAFDRLALLAELRANEPTARARAYRAVFGSDLGRFVIADHLADCGVGRAFQSPATADERAYQQGAHDAALKLMTLAGFDPSSAVLMVMTGDVEGHDDDGRSSGGRGDAERDPELGE